MDMGESLVFKWRSHPATPSFWEAQPTWSGLNLGGKIFFPAYFLLSLLITPVAFISLALLFVTSGILPIFLSLVLFVTPSTLKVLRGMWDLAELAFYGCFPFWLPIYQPTSTVITWSSSASRLSKGTVFFSVVIFLIIQSVRVYDTYVDFQYSFSLVDLYNKDAHGMLPPTFKSLLIPLSFFATGLVWLRSWAATSSP